MVHDLASLLTVCNSSCTIFTMNDVIGYIRVLLPRYARAGQEEAMQRNGVEKYLVEGGKKPKPTGTRHDVTRMMCEGRVLAIQHLFLLADPKTRSSMRRDLWKAIDEIEKRKGTIWELYTGLRSDDAKQRDLMMRNAVEALARGRHKRSDSDKRGRPKKEFTLRKFRRPTPHGTIASSRRGPRY
jgi:hypothetical protein